MQRSRLLHFVSIVGIGLSLGCSPEEGARSALNRAYGLMDEGQNAQASVLLERELARNPDSDETRILLASAYMGLSGVDIYSVYDRFSDLLFAKPLGESLLPQPIPSGTKPLKPKPGKTGQETSLEATIERLSRALDQLRQISGILDRFMKVPEEKWPLVERAIELVDAVETPTQDLRVYRVFVRIIYAKSYLQEKLLADETFGTREWACGLEWSRFRASVSRVRRILVPAVEDLRQIAPQKTRTIFRIEEIIREFDDFINEPAAAPAGLASSTFLVEHVVKEEFQCGN